jgi:hypothetical protein
MRFTVFLATVATSIAAHGQTTPFTGRWEVDLRSSTERASRAECGFAAFQLKQVGDVITGDHTMATVGCGRLNEGGPETVKGVAVGDVAVLVVSSGRNGAVVLGRARVRNGRLAWEYRELVKPGNPEDDSPLILGTATLLPKPATTR